MLICFLGEPSGSLGPLRRELRGDRRGRGAGRTGGALQGLNPGKGGRIRADLPKLGLCKGYIEGHIGFLLKGYFPDLTKPLN